VRDAINQKQIEAVWRQRADRLSQRPALAGAGQSGSPVIVLGLGANHYGISLPDVAEVLAPVRPTPVPGVSAVFSGVINVHGEIRPVIDLGRWLGMEASPKKGLVRVILLRRQGRELGLQVDSVEQIRWIRPDDLQPGLTWDPGLSKQIRGTTKDMLRLLSTDQLFDELQTGVTT
jgi:chemotaxis signal transduction protein